MSDNLPPSADDPGAIKSVHNLMAHEPHLNGIEVNVANAREDLCYARLRHPAAVGLCLFVLSGALYRRYQQTWQSCDVDECVELLREVIALLQRDYPEYTKALSMPVSASLLFRLTMPTEDSSASLIRDGQPVTIGYPSLSTGASYRTISMTIPELLWKSHINLCHALAERSIFRDSTEDAEEQINVARCVLAKLPEGHDLESEAWCALGTGLYIRCQRKGDRQDLHDALLAHRQATGACHARGYVCAQCLYTTACCLCLCDVAFSDRSCLSEALILLHEALCILPEQSVHHPRCHLQLGLALLRRLHLDGSLEDEKLSENHLQKALALLSRSHPQRGVALRALGVKSGVLYEQTSDVDAIHFAINCCREALEFQPEGNPERCRTLQSLSSALSARYELLGAAEDLSSAIEYVKESLKLRKTGRALTLQSLAALMSTKYDLCGDMSCLEDAIALYREALSLSHHGSEIHNVIVNNLGDALLKYHKHTGELVPLVEAVRHFHWVLDHRPLGHPRRGTAVVNLGEALVQRYKEFGNIEALDEAIKLYARWIERGNGNFFGQDEVLHQYATALLQCPASNIDESIHQYQCALKLRPLGNWARHRTLGNLASAFAQRFEIRGDVEDALTARKLQQEVMEILPATHPDRPLGVFGVARLLLLKSSPYFDISAAIDLLVSAVQDPACHPQVRLTEALGTAQKIIGILEPNLDSVSIKMLDAYRLMIAILPLVAFFGLNPRSRLRALEKASELASDAAFCAVQVNRVTDALEVLEEGRAVFWAQHLRLRARADGIPDDITRQLTSVSEQLRQGVVEGVLAGSGDDNAATAKLEAEAARMRRLSEEFDLLINKARCTPGNERFLMPRIFASLAGVAERGPVVLFIASQSGCTAILLMDSGRAPVAIKFPRTSLPDLQALSATVRKECLRGRNSLQNRAIQITQAKKSNPSLRVLWETIMQPVLQALGWQKSKGRSRRRLFFCPTGVFAHLPLHAATSFRDSCTDFCVASYTPTLTALLDARRSFRPLSKHSAQVLLAVVSRPFEGALLSGVAAEANVVAGIVPKQNLVSVGTGDQSVGDPTSGEVLRRLPGASILHLACHGQQDSKDPLESGFLMEDRRLTVAQIMALEMPSAFLALLSACDTAKGDTNQPDQAIHLAATMLYVGFKSVVGTMWSMNDTDGPLVAETIYKALYEGDAECFDPEVIPYALDEAVGKLRRRGLHPTRWAPYVHIGI